MHKRIFEQLHEITDGSAMVTLAATSLEIQHVMAAMEDLHTAAINDTITMADRVLFKILENTGLVSMPTDEEEQDNADLPTG